MELSLIFFGNPNSQQNKDNDISLKIIEYNTPPPPPPPCLLQCEAKIIVQWNLCLKHDSSWWYLLVRVLSRILSFEGEIPSGRQVAPKGVWGHATPPPPKKFFEMNMHWDVIWCNILRHSFEKCYSVFTDLVAPGWFFRYPVTYVYYDDNNIFFWGGGGGGKLGILGGSFYPSNTQRCVVHTGS